MFSHLAILLVACVKVPDPQGDDSDGLDSAPTGPDLVADTVPVIVSSTKCEACGGECVLEELSYATTYHSVERIDYADTPPAGGPHNPCWSTWGVHTEAVLDDNFVHNLEHGGIGFLYRDPTLAPDGDALATTLGEFMITTPYDGMATDFAAVSWGWRLLLGCYDEATLRSFYDTHKNQGPESSLSDPSSGCM